MEELLRYLSRERSWIELGTLLRQHVLLTLTALATLS
jgi:hypothetical protein